MKRLAELIAAYVAARAAWDIADPDGDCNCPEWEAVEAAEDAILRFSCQTFEDVQAKAKFFIECEPAYDTIKNCYTEREECLMTFLRSLTGEVQP